MDEPGNLFKEEEYRLKYGPNIIVNFVKSHDLAGMIAELIQNDFDATGRRLKISFLRDSLVAESYGAKVDKNGWERLSYLLGTPDEISKEKGIGKKNFGLRSLFLVGNQIAISSGGYMTGIIIDVGARRKRIRDNTIYPNELSLRVDIHLVWFK